MAEESMSCSRSRWRAQLLVESASRRRELRVQPAALRARLCQLRLRPRAVPGARRVRRRARAGQPPRLRRATDGRR